MNFTTKYNQFLRSFCKSTRALILHCFMAGGLAVFAGYFPNQQVLAATAPPFELGVNISGFNYWSSTIPFKDLIFQNGGLEVLKVFSNTPCAEQPSFNADGYPLYLPKECVFRIRSVFHISNELWKDTGIKPYRSGRYVLLFKGEGDVRLGWDAKNPQNGKGRIEFDVPNPADGIQIEVFATKRGNPIRDLHLVHKDDEKTYQKQPFNEQWLKLLKPFKVIRFMDWSGASQQINKFSGDIVSHSEKELVLPQTAPADDTAFDGMVAVVNVNGQWPRIFVDHYDGKARTLYLRSPIETSKTSQQPTVTIFDFPNKSWDRRAATGVFDQQSPAGVAYEYMIQLANTLNANPWITVPTAADDRFVEELAKLIKNTLNPKLKCHIEYSNETWNFSFPGYTYAEAKARDLNLQGTWFPADAWQALRGVEIFKIFNRVFSEKDLHEQRNDSRIIRVLTSQTVWPERAIMVMDWGTGNKAGPTGGLPAYKFADVWAIAPYFSALENSKPVEQASIDELIEMQLRHIDQMAAAEPEPGFLRRVIDAAIKRNLRVVQYENGTHLLAPQDQPEQVKKLLQMNRDPRMRDVYRHALDKWAELVATYGNKNVGVWNQYHDVGQYGRFGYWGMLEATTQDPATAPKYQAFLDYLKKYTQ